MDLKLISENFLPIEDTHVIYYAEYGNIKGNAILNIHGGPGLSSQAKYAQLFELEKYRVIVFDQRGCGKSIYHKPLYRNTTDYLIADIERIREILKIDKWFLNGGSWGSTLALAYALKYPNRILGLLLASTFLGRRKDMSWLYGQTKSPPTLIFPDVYLEYRQILQKYEITNQKGLKKLSYVMNTEDDSQRHEIAKKLYFFEKNMFSIESNPIGGSNIIDLNLANSKNIYLHYASNNFFLKKNYIINNFNILQEIPILLVHGRYDLVCPLEGIFEFTKNLDKLKLVILSSNGHSFTDKGKAILQKEYELFLALH